MKKRLHDKKAGIALLISLIVIALAELIFRAIVIKEAVLTTSNLGEQFAVLALAVTILILTAKGKDRACYLCYGAWIASFVMEQIFVLPGDIITAVTLSNPSALAIIIRSAAALTSIGIIAIGAMLVEYMNDGTINNRLFNSICIVTIVMTLCTIVFPAYAAITRGSAQTWLGVFDGVKTLIMIFLCTFFAYDSAKAQLKKTDLTE